MASTMPAVKPGDHLVFEGDSVTSRESRRHRGTWPYLRLIHCHRTWPDVFTELAFCWRAELRLKFTITAAGGSSCRAIADRYESDVQPLKPDWIVMTTGGNDVRLEIPPEEFGQILGDYGRRAHADSGAQVVFVPGWCEAPHRPEKMQMPRIQPYYDQLAALAEQHAFLHWLDIRDAVTGAGRALYEQWSGHSLFSGPDNHYNEIGATVIAGAVLEGLGLLQGPRP
jgi:lysophospholipase L1-like esterase